MHENYNSVYNSLVAPHGSFPLRSSLAVHYCMHRTVQVLKTDRRVIKPTLNWNSKISKEYCLTKKPESGLADISEEIMRREIEATKRKMDEFDAGVNQWSAQNLPTKSFGTRMRPRMLAETP